MQNIMLNLEKYKKKTIENNSLTKVYNQYRLNKVQKNHARIVRYETEILKKKNRHLRELFMGDLVYVEAGRIKKKDQPTKLTKKTTDLKPHFNTKVLYKVINKVIHRESGPFVHHFYRVTPVDRKNKNISHRLARDEVFAIVNNTIY